MRRMFSKKNIALLCLFCLTVTLLCGAGFAAPEETEAQDGFGEATELAALDPIPLYVDGIRVGDGLLLESTTYVPVRAFCRAMGRDLHMEWDEETETMTVTLERDIAVHDWDEPEEFDEAPGEAVAVPEDDELGETVRKSLLLTAANGDEYLTANGRCIWAPTGLRMVDEVLMAPIRCLAQVFDLDVIWHDETRSVSLDSRQLDILEDAESVYDEEDLYWLSHIIYAESGNQPLDGMIGVGNVVLNRVADPSCPDTVYDVIFDTRYGVQFSPTETGTINDDPNELSIVAAKLCLEGANVAENSLFFVNPDIGTSSWFRNTRTYVCTIADHAFYA